MAPFLVRMRASNDLERLTPDSPFVGDTGVGACRKRSGMIGIGGGGGAEDKAALVFIRIQDILKPTYKLLWVFLLSM